MERADYKLDAQIFNAPSGNGLLEECRERILRGVFTVIAYISILFPAKDIFGTTVVTDKLVNLLDIRDSAVEKTRSAVSKTCAAAIGKILEVFPLERNTLNGPPDFFCDGEPQPFTQHKPRLGVQRRDRAIEYCHQG